MVGLKYNTDLPVNSHMKTFYISIKFIVVFHVNMFQQLHLPANSIIRKHDKIPTETFNLTSTQLLNLIENLIDVWN